MSTLCSYIKAANMLLSFCLWRLVLWWCFTCSLLFSICKAFWSLLSINHVYFHNIICNIWPFHCEKRNILRSKAFKQGSRKSPPSILPQLGSVLQFYFDSLCCQWFIYYCMLIDMYTHTSTHIYVHPHMYLFIFCHSCLRLVDFIRFL